MKQVVLSEGKRDVELVRCYYEQFHGDKRMKTFVGEQVEYSELKNRESNAIENFLEPRNPYDVLAKSENGKPDLKMIFTKMIRYLSSRGVQVCLLIDLDGNDHGELIRDLHERVRTNYEGSNLEVRHDERIDRSSAQIATRNHLLEDGDVRGAFDVVAFHSDLETALEIGNDDSDDVEGRKLREFVSDDRHASPLHRVL